jgi:biotin carboxyl carrier protein
MLPRYVDRHWEVFFWLVATMLAGILALLIAGTTSGANTELPDNDPTAERIFIVSPSNGIFCASEFLGSAPYVTIGSRVAPDTIVCNIQDRDVTPVRAGMFGTIVDILAANDQMVFMGQPLFEVQPDPITVE